MTDEAVITGTFADMKLVKTRSAMQLVIEVPIEHGKKVIEAFGLPVPGAEIPVAVARLAAADIVPQPQKQRNGKLAQRSALLCADPRFLRFIGETCPSIRQPRDANEAADAVRMVCGVKSRAEFDTNDEAAQRWLTLKGKFDAWLVAA